MSKMTGQQLRNIAVGFLHVLRTQDSVYQDSINLGLKSGDFKALGEFIASAMHLESAPTADEVKWMDDYLYEHMKTDTAALKAVRPAGPANYNTFSRSTGAARSVELEVPIVEKVAP